MQARVRAAGGKAQNAGSGRGASVSKRLGPFRASFPFIEPAIPPALQEDHQMNEQKQGWERAVLEKLWRKRTMSATARFREFVARALSKLWKK